jgi:Mg/Co/Ni transporter MgtE
MVDSASFFLWPKEIQTFNKFVKDINTDKQRAEVLEILNSSEPFHQFQWLSLSEVYAIYKYIDKNTLALPDGCSFVSIDTFLVRTMLCKSINGPSIDDKEFLITLLQAVYVESKDILLIVERLEDKNTFLASLDYHLAALLLVEMKTGDAVEIIKTFDDEYNYHGLITTMSFNEAALSHASDICAKLSIETLAKIFIWNEQYISGLAHIIQKLWKDKAVSLCNKINDSEFVAQIVSFLPAEDVANILILLNPEFAKSIVINLKRYGYWYLVSDIFNSECMAVEKILLILERNLTFGQQVELLIDVKHEKLQDILNNYPDQIQANNIRKKLWFIY